MTDEKPDTDSTTPQDDASTPSETAGPPGIPRDPPGSSVPPGSTAAPEPSDDPYEASELKKALVGPTRILQVVLSEQGRFMSTIAQRKHLGLLVMVMLVASTLYTLPYGLVFTPERFWKVLILYLGSFGICFPSLQIFSTYIGCRMDTSQNLALGLVITSVAALFTLGFFPILWFLQLTMTNAEAMVRPYHINLALLAFSLLAGILHLVRCLARFRGITDASPVLIFSWIMLFAFITYRMALLLEIIG